MNNITITNFLYEELLIKSYKYDTFLKIFKSFSRINENGNFYLTFGVEQALTEFIKLNEELMYNDLIKKCEEDKKIEQRTNSARTTANNKGKIRTSVCSN